MYTPNLFCCIEIKNKKTFFVPVREVNATQEPTDAPFLSDYSSMISHATTNDHDITNSLKRRGTGWRAQ